MSGNVNDSKKESYSQVGSDIGENVILLRGDTWKAPVANLAALPATGNTAGDVRLTLDTGLLYTWSGSAWATASAGSGTVTSVSVTTANGVSGSVATSTTTPAITITLGAITPTSVNSVVISGASTPTLAVTGTTTVSGSNTGDQTITLTGAVTGSGTGSFATTIATPGTLTVASTNSTATAHTHAITSSSAPGAAASILATDSSGIIGSTGTRIVKGWFTDITVTNALAGSITGNAATVTTNANLTGHITSTGNAAILGSFTKAQLNTAVSDGDPMYLDSTDTVTGAKTFSTAAALGSSTATTQTPADNSTKVATTAYVDNAILGQRTKEAVKYASIAALPSIVYSNGSSGVGATLTGVALAAISLDSSSPAVADRVLIKNQAAPEQNGIYVVTAAGSGAAVFVLTRAIDFDQAADIQTGDSVFVTAGSTLASTTWTYNGIDSPTMGTTGITLVQSAGPGSFTAGNGITITGVSIAIDTAVTVDKTTVQTLSNKTFTAPVLGAATATSINGLIITTTTGTITMTNAKTLAVTNTLTLSGTDSTVMTFPTTSATIARTDAANTFTGVSTATSWVFTTPVLGTPTSGTLTNCTGLPIAGLVASTSTAIGVGSIELGHATDTTMAREAAGIISVENEIINGYATTATAAGTTTLTRASANKQVFTGTTTQTVTLPTTGIILGQQYVISNKSTGKVTVQSSGANTVYILGTGNVVTFTSQQATPTTAAHWEYTLIDGIDNDKDTTATANAATIDLMFKKNIITNNSAATLTITLPTAGAVDGMLRMVRVLDFSAVAQTITWVNTENSDATVPTTSNGSTTLPRTVGFQYNAATSKFRCLANV